jgi:hypothetical protein
LLPRIFASSRSGIPTSCRPRSFTLPFTRAEPGSRPMTASDDTDFPDPDSPTMPSTSPGASV